MVDSKVAEREARYRQLVEGLPMAVCTCDKEGRIELYNAAAEALWGRKPETGDLWCGSWKISKPDGTVLSLDEYPMATVLKKGIIVQTEVIIERPDGSRRNVIAHPQPVYDSSSNIVGAMNMLQDITGEKRIEKELEESELRLRLATEGAGLAIWDLDLQTQQMICSSRLNEIFGHPSEAVLSHRQILSQIYPEDQAAIEQAFADAMISGVYQYEARVVHTDRSLRWIKTQGSVLFDEKQVPVRMLGTLLDVTVHKTAEEKAATLAAIVNSSDDAIISKTLEGIVTSWNDSAERIFGYTAAEMIGQSISKLIPQERSEEEPQILQRLHRGERVEHFETQRITKDRRLLDISLTISPVKDSQGKIIGASKAARDISQKKHAERLINESE